MKLLNLGCGQNYHKDWINIDFVSSSDYVIPHNLLRGIPLKNQSVDIVYHSHVLEHFSKNDGLKFMEECWRVLKPGGIIRIAVPDLEVIAKEYLRNLELAVSGNIEGKLNYEWIILELLDQMVRNTSGGEMKEYLFQSSLPNEKYIYERIGAEGKLIRSAFLEGRNPDSTKIEISLPQRSLLKRLLHRIKKNLYRKSKKTEKDLIKTRKEVLRIGQFRMNGEIHQWMYDRYSLQELLHKTGFKKITLCNPFQSEIEHWSSYELDVIDGEVRKPDSLFIEAIKA